jgi:hypothetical protein
VHHATTRPEPQAGFSRVLRVVRDTAATSALRTFGTYRTQYNTVPHLKTSPFYDTKVQQRRELPGLGWVGLGWAGLAMGTPCRLQVVRACGHAGDSSLGSRRGYVVTLRRTAAARPRTTSGHARRRRNTTSRSMRSCPAAWNSGGVFRASTCLAISGTFSAMRRTMGR